MSLLGIAGSLLGGILGRNSEKKAIAAQNAYNAPSAVRQRAEDAGFNPLLFVGPGVGQQTATGGTNFMGSAIADAGLIAADTMAKKSAQAVAIAELTEKNKKLVDKVNTMTLRPKVGGIYSQTVTVPSARQAMGVKSERSDRVLPVSQSSDVGGSGGFGPSGVRPLSEKLQIDSRREVQNDKIKTHSGFMVVDNPNLPFKLYAPTLDGDEQLEWYQYPSLVVPAAIGGAEALFSKPRGADGKVGRSIDDAYFGISNLKRPKKKPSRGASGAWSSP